MAIEIVVPRLGWSMEEGVFVGWHKQDGDTVKPGEVLFSIEGDKAIQEVECIDGGILRIPAAAPQPGTKVVVGAVLGYVTHPGEALPAPAEASPRATAASPRAMRAARELNVDLATLRGGGSSGRIRERDVRAVAAAGTGTAQLAPLRRQIAQRLGAGNAVPVTLNATADATQLITLKQQAGCGFTELLVRLAAAALQRHPALNASWKGDAIETHQGIHIGIAVDTEGGLLVPVVRDVPSLSLTELAARTRDLAERARGRRLRPEEMQGGTFTVTNLGGFGIDAFTPVINPPQCAVLGVGRIAKRPFVAGNQVVARDLITLSLSFDHRIVDGAPAARFLQTLVKMIEAPNGG